MSKTEESSAHTRLSRRDFVKTSLAVAASAAIEANIVQAAPVIDDGNQAATTNTNTLESLSALATTHDLRLPAWGPYTKTYNGIAHVPGIDGTRFDLSVFPGYYRRQVLIPNVRWESGYHPWLAAPNFEFFSYRYELEWKDRVYCDVSFAEVSNNVRVIRCELVNRTSANQNLVLHFMASINFPSIGSARTTPALQPALVSVPESGVWIDALDYAKLHFANPRPTDNLVYEGWRRAEMRASSFTQGGGIGTGFGKDAGDTVLYRFQLTQPVTNPVLAVRYRLPEATTEVASAGRVPVTLRAEGLASTSITFDFHSSLDLKIVRLPRALAAGTHELRLTSTGGELEIDGFAIIESDRLEALHFTPVELDYRPDISTDPQRNSMLLKYKAVSNTYGLRWNFDNWEAREFLTNNLDTFFRLNVHEHVATILKDPNYTGDGHFTNVFLRPIPLASQSSKTIYGVVANGERTQVENTLATFDLTPTTCETIIKNQQTKAATFADAAPTGRTYSFSQQRMAATLLTNVVYPIYTRRSYIKHYTPGRWWDSLYTWDSGFIGLGLTELDINRAVDCLNTYTTPAGDEDAAFLHHGSPVPVQIYLFQELWSRTGSRELLAYFYPRLRQMYMFLAGHLGSSTTRNLKSNLLRTWDYFYNSGGWDDYPPQKYVHAEKLEATVTPVINTAHCIRTAKILRQAAREMGATNDIAIYDADIETLGAALQQHSWDEASGYFGYVRHDASGNPVGILRHGASNQNYNFGMDGAYPLVAGICTLSQEEKLIERLMSERRMWTPIGLSTVDKSAPYYTPDGYWNGAVWMPHQWFFWKTLLDLGRGDAAYLIARTALDTWKREVEESYNCFEHFIVQSGRGAGWHQFGALSAPVLLWFAAYHRPGRLTCGFNTRVVKQRFTADNHTLTATLETDSPTNRVAHIVATMNSDGKYHAMWNERHARAKELMPGVLNVEIPSDKQNGRLQVIRRENTVL